ncbi:MAG: DNRLRE domain-containing protein [Candidatus Rokubacteria bacterium]|nr:DNRLRE domain-containing protein [Candidatus Rokubacteria bacterium]
MSGNFAAALSITLTVLLAAGLGLPASATALTTLTVEIDGARDATIRDHTPNSNFSRSRYLTVRSHAHRRGDDCDDDDEDYRDCRLIPKNARALLRFDLSKIPSNAVIDSAVLELYMKKAPKRSRLYRVHRLTNGFSPSFVTWTQRGDAVPWTTPGGDFTTAASASAWTGTRSKQPVRWTITDDVKAWQMGAPSLGLLVKDAVENARRLYRAHFQSTRGDGDNDRDDAHPPRLVVTLRPVFEVVGLGVSAGDGYVRLAWTNPNPSFDDAARLFTGVLVIRKAGSAPQPNLADGCPHGDLCPWGVGHAFADGSVVVDSHSAALGSADGFRDTAVSDGTRYFYMVVTYNGTTTYSSGRFVSATPFAPPPPGQFAVLWSFGIGRPPLPQDTVSPPPIAVPGLPASFGFTGLPGIYFADAFTGAQVYGITSNGSAELFPPDASNQRVPRTAVNVSPVSGTGGTRGEIVVGDGSGRVTTFDALTGAPVWSVVPAGVDSIVSTPITQVRDYGNAAFQAAQPTDLVFVASANLSSRTNRVLALRLAADPANPATRPAGSVAWQFVGTPAVPLDRVVGTPFIDYDLNRLYVTSLAGPGGTQPSLWIISTLDGQLVKSFPLGPISGSVGISLVAAPPTDPDYAIVVGSIYVANDAGQLHAVNARSAPPALKWAAPTSLTGAVQGFVWEDFFVAGRLYCTTADGFMWSLQDTGTGTTQNWKRALPGVSEPLLFDTVFYVTAADGKVHEIPLADGVEVRPAVQVAYPGESLGPPGNDVDGVSIIIGTSDGRVVAVQTPF